MNISKAKSEITIQIGKELINTKCANAASNFVNVCPLTYLRVMPGIEYISSAPKAGSLSISIEAAKETESLFNMVKHVCDSCKLNCGR